MCNIRRLSAALSPSLHHPHQPPSVADIYPPLHPEPIPEHHLKKYTPVTAEIQ
jgi:hypothetical protein